MKFAEVRITKSDWERLNAHLFSDREEHGAVLLCSVAVADDRLSLLVREVVLASEGVDYVEGIVGHRALTPDFVGDNIDRAADLGFTYLAVHNHGGRGSVAFSGIDLDSHERGYPALLQFAGGPPVGALVLSRDCVAGDIWLPTGGRIRLDRLVVVGLTSAIRRPTAARMGEVGETHNRQALLFGQVGQARLAEQVVAIVGLGGVGSIIAELLSRLGVGQFLLIDPDEIEASNLSRVVGAEVSDARPRRQMLAGRLRPQTSRKVDVAARVIHQANPRAVVDTVVASVAEAEVAARLTGVDHIFLAADSAQARLVVNAVAHQYLVPVTQIGSKVQVHDGAVTDVFSVVRSVAPALACLNCSGLISAAKLQEEGTDEEQRQRQRYVDDDMVHVPSVVALNSLGASRAVSDWMLEVAGLRSNAEAMWSEFHLLTDEAIQVEPRIGHCLWCRDRAAAGDSARLPTTYR